MIVIMKERPMVRRPKVTVYITCADYGRYLSAAIESVLRQIMDDWELIVVDDCSHDDSLRIAEQFAAQYPNHIRVYRNAARLGLRASANTALELARGEYIMRLDGDDYLDDAALLVLAAYLDRQKEVALVYPNWTYVAEDGSYLGTEYRKHLGTETSVLDLPPHGACTMVRKRVLKSVGGYDPSYGAQDGHELWLKVLHRYKVGNVTAPLFFYRQHNRSMSRDEEQLLSSRRKIKAAIAARQGGKVRPRMVAIMPAKNSYAHMPDVVLQRIGGKRLIDYTIEAARGAGLFELLYVTTDDPRIVEYCKQYSDVLAEVRPLELSDVKAKLADVLTAAVQRLETIHNVYADIIVLLSVHAPLRRSEHICEAVDTLLVYDVDNVVSTYEDLDVHFVHAKEGLRPLNPGMINRLRFERETLFVDNNAVHVYWRDHISSAGLYEGRVGHFVMPRAFSQTIKTQSDVAVVRALLENISALGGERIGGAQTRLAAPSIAREKAKV